MIKVSSLKKNPENPRQIRDEKFEKLKASIQEFPQMMALRPMIVDETNTVLGGNMRLNAIKALGMTEIPDEWVKRSDELTDEEKKRFVITDNSSFGEYDWAAIANEWSDLPLADWGLDVPGLEAVEEVGDADAEPQIDKAAELNKKWKVKTGDLWQIGEHRLLCGDSTKPTNFTAAICVTSPPYNAGETPTELKAGKSSKYEENADNLTQGDYLQFICDFTEQALGVCEYAFVNIQCLAGNKLAFIGYLSHFADRFADFIIWDKENSQPAMAEKVLNSQFEFIVCLTSKPEATRAIGTRDFRGTVSNVYKAPPQRQNEFSSVHSATFPIHLPTFLVQAFSNVGDAVFEPFAGSGTTLVACQNLNRKCYAIEISENYCAVILERMATAFPDIEIKRIEDAKSKGKTAN